MTHTPLAFKNLMLASAAAFLITPAAAFAAAEKATLAEALTGGTAYLHVRSRYENVDQAGFVNDASAITLQTRLGYRTGRYQGFSGVLEFEDSRNLADENYNNTLNGKSAYPVIADPSHTEVNQAYLTFSGLDDTTVSAGRQTVNLGSQRFVGSVGWRQNDQNLDAVSLVNTSLADTRFYYAYVWNVNRIFGNDSPMGDHAADHHLFNAEYDGLKFGKVTAYAYLLDNNDAPGLSSNSFGIRFAGESEVAAKTHVLYELEYANQRDAAQNPGDYSVDYFHVAGGARFAGATLKAGFESLGSEDGVASFQTPLATLHKFNGWADIFLSTPTAGLEDLYITGIYKFDGMFKGLMALATYHKFTSQFGDTDYGDELDLLLAYNIDKNYNVAVKYADYNADTFAADTRKIWLTLGVNF